MGFLFFPVMPMGLRSAALRAAGAPLILHVHDENCTSFIVSLLVQKMGEGDAYFNFWSKGRGCLFWGGGGSIIRGLTVFALSTLA